ncbi:MAG: hypothetical protein JWN04_4583 [Myxococcaceae bacterium]|nr:hypothetical protein [Myxococcaceae bacterium]
MHDFLFFRAPSPLSTALLVLSLSSACADSKAPVASDESPAEGNPDAGETNPLASGGKVHDASLDAGSPRRTSDAGSPDGGHKSEPTGSSLDASADASSAVVDAGITLRPFPTNGEVLKAPDKKWTYIEFPDTQCRDGSKAGIAVSLESSSKKLMIFLEGGGACFDPISCLANPANTSGMQAEQTAGIWDRSNSQNPVRDWNFVYVPYCTGDTHAGAKPDGMVAGVGPQKFVGYLNMQKFLNRIVPTFKDATDVLLTGISAGGFGAAQNAVLVQRAFSNVKVRAVDDSGPPLSKDAIAPCLQDKWRTTWGLDQSYLDDCGADCPKKDDFAQDYGLFLAKTFADRSSGLIESAQDSIISGFFGAGLNNCTGVVLLTPVPGDVFQKDLLAFREKVKPYSSFSTYIPSGTQHTWLSNPTFYTGTAGGTKLVDWFTKIVNNEVPGHVGP